MLGEIVWHPSAKRVFKVHAFFFNRDALVVDRGQYEFQTRTVEDHDWQWLSRQVDTDQIVYGDVCASDLIYDSLPSGVIVGRDPILGYIRLILAPVN